MIEWDVLFNIHQSIYVIDHMSLSRWTQSLHIMLADLHKFITDARMEKMQYDWQFVLEIQCI